MCIFSETVCRLCFTKDAVSRYFQLVVSHGHIAENFCLQECRKVKKKVNPRSNLRSIVVKELICFLPPLVIIKWVLHFQSLLQTCENISVINTFGKAELCWKEKQKHVSKYIRRHFTLSFLPSIFSPTSLPLNRNLVLRASYLRARHRYVTSWTRPPSDFHCSLIVYTYGALNLLVR